MSSSPPLLSAVAGQWADRPPEETLHTAAVADELGFPELWIGETSTYDAFSLATAIGLATDSIPLTLGPLPVARRDPAMIAMGAASVASLTRRRVRVALGASPSPEAGAGDGGARAGGAATLAASAEAVTTLLSGEPADDSSVPGYKLRLDAPGGQVTVAAFGPRAVRAAAEHADRMVAELVSVETARRLRTELDAAAAKAGRPAPKLAVWLPAAVDPAPESLAQLVRALVPYLAAPGHAEMFTEAGFGTVVEVARGGAGYREILNALPLEIVNTVSLIGDTGAITARLSAYAEAGVDEIAVVPATAADRGGVATLQTIRKLG